LREISLQVGFKVENLVAEEIINKLIFGVGTELITGGSESSLGGVYKLVAVAGSSVNGSHDDPTQWQPRIKISAQPVKMTNPGLKRVTRLLRNGFIVADIIGMPDEEIKPGMSIVGINPINPVQQKTYTDFDSVEALHVPIFENGRLVYQMPDLKQVKEFANNRLRTIRLESRRLENPHTLKVSLTERYWQYKQAVIEQSRSLGTNADVTRTP
jgi:nicotinate phosphoribosyltransferase